MMKIGIYQVDGKMPNLALMQIARYHENQGDHVENYQGLLFASTYDKIYMSKIFDFSPMPEIPENAVVGGTGIYFNRQLALKFAAWLDVAFEVWVFSTIDNLIFGNYKKHWEAHAIQEAAKIEMDRLKVEMLTNPNIETNRAYFEAMDRRTAAKTAKSKAIRQQLKLFTEIGTKTVH